MRIVAAFDSFKESMSAFTAGEAIKDAAGDNKVVIKPMADGGEGTMEAINSALAGTIHEINVTGPNFLNVSAKLSIADDLAVIESAQACGLEYLSDEEKNGALMTTLGVGEMIHYAISQGVHKIYLTLGGSASNDGGIGMLTALGVQFLDSEGDTLVPAGSQLIDIDQIDATALANTLKANPIQFIGICDVNNPLLGKNGATYVYGKQKGIDERLFAKLDGGMRHYAKLSAKVNGKDVSEKPGAGAAGGLGFALMSYLNGELVHGIDAVMQLTHLEDSIKNCDLVFTGEGKMDRQTLMGKTPFGVLQMAKKYHKPVAAFAGKVEDQDELLAAGFDDIRCINHDPVPLSEMLKNGKENLTEEVRRYFAEHQDV